MDTDVQGPCRALDREHRWTKTNSIMHLRALSPSTSLGTVHLGRLPEKWAVRTPLEISGHPREVAIARRAQDSDDQLGSNEVFGFCRGMAPGGYGIVCAFFRASMVWNTEPDTCDRLEQCRLLDTELQRAMLKSTDVGNGFEQRFC